MATTSTTSPEYLAGIALAYGSISSRVEAVAVERGYSTRTGRVNYRKLAADSGISTSTLWYMIGDKSRFRAFNLVTLAKLCRVLGTQPGDLLDYVPGGAAASLGVSSDAFANLQGFGRPMLRRDDTLEAEFRREAAEHGESESVV